MLSKRAMTTTIRRVFLFFFTSFFPFVIQFQSIFYLLFYFFFLHKFEINNFFLLAVTRSKYTHGTCSRAQIHCILFFSSSRIRVNFFFLFFCPHLRTLICLVGIARVHLTFSMMQPFSQSQLNKVIKNDTEEIKKLNGWTTLWIDSN